MAYRNIEDKMWMDPVFRKLDPEAKLVFIYMITNSHGHLSGLYCLPRFVIAGETGVPDRVLDRVLDTLSKGYLALYDHDLEVVWVVNMLRYQGSGDKIRKAVAAQIDRVHKSFLIREFLEKYPDLGIPCPDTLSHTLSHRVSHQEQEQEQEQEYTVASDEPTQPAPAEIEKPKPTDEEREAPWREWHRVAAEDLRGYATGDQIRHVAAEAERCLEEYYGSRGGRWTPTRKGRMGTDLLKVDPQAALVAMEIFCDQHGATKDERYLVGIARRLNRASTDEFRADLERHRKTYNGRGIWSGRPK